MSMLCRLGGAELAWWPEAQRDLSDEVLLRDGAEEARVVGVCPVVSHDEDVVLGHDHRSEGVDAGSFAGGGAFSCGDVGLVWRFAVNQQSAFLYRDLISRQPDDPFYDLFVLFLVDAFEDHEVALLGVDEVVDKLIRQYAVSRLQRRGHALTRDVHRLRNKGTDKTEDHHQHHDERPGAPVLTDTALLRLCRREPAVEALASLLARRGPIAETFAISGARRESLLKTLAIHGGRGYRTCAGTSQASARRLSGPLSKPLKGCLACARRCCSIGLWRTGLDWSGSTTSPSWLATSRRHSTSTGASSRWSCAAVVTGWRSSTPVTSSSPSPKAGQGRPTITVT